MTEPYMRKRTITFKSRSGRGTYQTFRARDGKTVCTCPGFMWQQKCWHVEKVSRMK